MSLSLTSRVFLADALVREIHRRNCFPEVTPVYSALVLGELLQDLGGMAGVW